MDARAQLLTGPRGGGQKSFLSLTHTVLTKRFGRKGKRKSGRGMTFNFINLL